MAAEKKTRNKSRQVSVLNWMGTLLLCSIPGVNLIALLCFAIFGKSPSKRHYAAATLIWLVLALAIIVALLLWKPDEAVKLADQLRALAQTKAAPAVLS